MSGIVKVKNISVVIPFYNGSDFIERAIKSALAQTRPPQEIIVVDDGSSADEAAALAAIADQYPIRILTKENGGQGSARNVGIKAAKSDFIALLDQDDFFLEWHHEHLARVVESRGDERTAFAYGDLWRTDGAGNVITHESASALAEHPKVDLFSHLRYDCFILPSATLIRRDAFLAIGGFDDRFSGYEDDDLFVRFFATGYTSIYDPRPVTSWTVNEASTTFSVRFSRSRFLYFEKTLNAYPNRPNVNWFTLRDVLVPRFMFNFVQDYLRSCFLDDGHYVENKDRLRKFAGYISQDPGCSGLKRQKLQLRILLALTPRGVRAVGFILSTRLGALLTLGRGRQNRQRFRELVWLRKHG